MCVCPCVRACVCLFHRGTSEMEQSEEENRMKMEWNALFVLAFSSACSSCLRSVSLSLCVLLMAVSAVAAVLSIVICLLLTPENSSAHFLDERTCMNLCAYTH